MNNNCLVGSCKVLTKAEIDQQKEIAGIIETILQPSALKTL